jgi:2-dehydro-3-deoxygluconokinase
MAGRFVAFGEVMWRLSPPGRELLLQSARRESWVAGAEANVVTALAKLGHDSALVSALPQGPLGEAALVHLRGHGVDTRGIARGPGRMGLYFVTSGAGLRATDVVYDRAGSLFADTPPDAWDWDALLDGADRLHLSGITPALGPKGTAAALAAASAATARHVPISFDGNYRAKLWEVWDGRPRETLTALIAQADILFGNHRDVALLLGQPFSGEGAERRREAATAAFAAFPKLRLIASTARHVENADHHRLAARLDTPERGHQTAELTIAGIVDRVGTGDAFAAGILHGLRCGQSLEEVADTGLALAALKHSLPGDATLFSRDDLDAFRTGGMDVRR